LQAKGEHAANAET